ncbi:MAG: hypothetical protein CM15mP18_0130 [Methanobacteriota archaeon]|nr:MAG: hypothetical protein CM15mP18_0130 [Euryarchaeota archaeon]
MVDGPETTLPDVDDIARPHGPGPDTAPLHLSLEGHHEGGSSTLTCGGPRPRALGPLTCKKGRPLHLHLSGDAGWCGLHLTGKVANGSHLSVVVTDELHLESLWCVATTGASAATRPSKRALCRSERLPEEVGPPPPPRRDGRERPHWAGGPWSGHAS